MEREKMNNESGSDKTTDDPLPEIPTTMTGILEDIDIETRLPEERD